MLRPFRLSWIPFARRTGSKEFDGFIAEDGRLSAARDDIFDEDPGRLLRLFLHCQKRHLRPSPLLRKLIKETGYDTTRFKPATLGAWISEVKSARATGEPGGELEGGGIEEEVLRKVYTRYVASLEENNALDFDDLQLKTLELFERHPAVRDAYARRFRYVMVDEYQDTNRVQYLLARHLSSAHGNLAVCGDPDQSIYSWRGADIRNILDFEQDYPDPAVVKLERNYRSSGNILRAAQAVISNNTARKPKELITDRDDGEPVRVFLCGDENDEATEIGHRIQSHLARGRRASEIAVFYRLNFMQRALETTFTRQRISYQVLGGVEFFQRKEIRDLIVTMVMSLPALLNVSLPLHATHVSALVRASRALSAKAEQLTGGRPMQTVGWLFQSLHCLVAWR